MELSIKHISGITEEVVDQGWRLPEGLLCWLCDSDFVVWETSWDRTQANILLILGILGLPNIPTTWPVLLQTWGQPTFIPARGDEGFPGVWGLLKWHHLSYALHGQDWALKASTSSSMSEDGGECYQGIEVSGVFFFTWTHFLLSMCWFLASKGWFSAMCTEMFCFKTTQVLSQRWHPLWHPASLFPLPLKLVFPQGFVSWSTILSLRCFPHHPCAELLILALLIL